MQLEYPPAIFGILGNLDAIAVFLAHWKTFYAIYKNKSTLLRFSPIPYCVALFNTMMLIFYSCMKEDALFLFTINIIGSIIELLYVVVFLVYASKKAKIITSICLMIFHVGLFGSFVVCLMQVRSGGLKLAIIKWCCFFVSILTFASPLSTLAPNVIGIACGAIQMALYFMYKDGVQEPEAEGRWNLYERTCGGKGKGKGKARQLFNSIF